MFKVNGEEVKTIRFPAGEVSPVLSRDNVIRDRNLIQWDFESTEEVFVLCQLVDAIYGSFTDTTLPTIDLLVPYFPFSRQDRRVNAGESNSLKVICGIIKSLNFENVMTYDPHSMMLSAYLGDRLLLATPQYNCLATVVSKLTFSQGYSGKQKLLLVSPDQGASKKTQECANILNVIKGFDVDILQCLKSRDPSSGKLNKLEVFYKGQDFSDYDILVVDDICDGGATFISIAKELKELGIKGKSLNLYTTHGIYSKGMSELKKYYDNVKCFYRLPVAEKYVTANT